MLGYVLSSSEIKLTCLRLVAESCHSDWTLHRLWFVSYTPVQWQGWTFDMTATVCFCIRPFLNLCCDAGQHGFSQRIFPSRSTKWICWWASLLLLPRDPSLSLFVFFGWKMSYQKSMMNWVCWGSNCELTRWIPMEFPRRNPHWKRHQFPKICLGFSQDFKRWWLSAILQHAPGVMLSSSFMCIIYI